MKCSLGSRLEKEEEHQQRNSIKEGILSSKDNHAMKTKRFLFLFFLGFSFFALPPPSLGVWTTTPRLALVAALSEAFCSGSSVEFWAERSSCTQVQNRAIPKTALIALDTEETSRRIEPRVDVACTSLPYSSFDKKLGLFLC